MAKRDDEGSVLAWERCPVGCSASGELYWLVSYNSPLRGFVKHEGGSFTGYVCEQMANPFSTSGIVDTTSLDAENVEGAIELFEAYCARNGHAIR